MIKNLKSQPEEIFKARAQLGPIFKARLGNKVLKKLGSSSMILKPGSKDLTAAPQKK